jgi:hypothetical protein
MVDPGRRRSGRAIPAGATPRSSAKSPQVHHRSPNHMCQPHAKFCKVLLAIGSTRSTRAGCGCRLL